MAIGNETFNNELYQLLKVRGYRPTPLNSQNQRVKASQEADVIEFDFVKDGEDYGKAWISIDDASNVCVYFDDDQAESPSNATPGAEYDDTWTGLLKHLKQWAQRRQLSFELANKDRLGDDMRQRDYYKMKEKLGESYHPMGKKASYNDAVPNVKIVLQHNRSLEEGEARFRNVARIYLENVDGERFLAPTNKPGLARVYARHIAEGGLPNDEKWNHIKSICEEYQQMAGFVRATRKGQFNESAQQLVNEGINHYNNLRETLHKLAGHRGYHAYFESYTPALMEDDTDISINELFVQETMDPRIESVMPILSRLHKKVSESSSVPVDELSEWADTVISEKLELSSEKPAEKAKDKEHQELIDFYTKKYGEKDGRKKADSVYAAQKKKDREPEKDDDYSAKDTKLQKYEKKAKKKLSKKRFAEGESEDQSNVVKFKPRKNIGHSVLAKDFDDEFGHYDDLGRIGKLASINDRAEDDMDWDDDSWIPDIEDFEHEEMAKELSRHRGRFAANDLNEMEKDLYQGRRRDPREGPRGPDKTAKAIPAKKAAKDAGKLLNKAFKSEVEEGIGDKIKKGVKSLKRGMLGWEKGMHDVETVKRNTATLSPSDKEDIANKPVMHPLRANPRNGAIAKGSPAELQQKLIKREKNKEVDEATGYYSEKHPKHDQMTKDGYEHSIEDILGDKLHRYFKPGVSLTDLYKYDDEEVKEDLGPEQKRVGQLGPTEKVKNNNIGKLVGASESKEMDPELARIIEMAKFKR